MLAAAGDMSGEVKECLPLFHYACWQKSERKSNKCLGQLIFRGLQLSRGLISLLDACILTGCKGTALMIHVSALAAARLIQLDSITTTGVEDKAMQEYRRGAFKSRTFVNSILLSSRSFETLRRRAMNGSLHPEGQRTRYYVM